MEVFGLLLFGLVFSETYLAVLADCPDIGEKIAVGNYLSAEKTCMSEAPELIEGTPASECEYPYFLALQLGEGFPPKDGKGFRFLGGAALIHPHWAVTAASIVDDINLETVKPAVFGGSLNMAGPFKQVSPAANVFLHPTWKSSPILERGMDIALIKLECPLDLPTIALPDPWFDVEPQAELWITGFGRGSVNGAFRSKLQHLLMHSQSNNDCSKALNYQDVPPHLICTGQKTGAVCQGDAGGPLVFKTTGDQHVLVGVAPEHVGDCSDFGNPVLFTSVAFAREWIIETMNDNSETQADHPNCKDMRLGITGTHSLKKELVNGKAIVGSLIRGTKQQSEGAKLTETAFSQNRVFALRTAVKEASQRNLVRELAYAFVEANMTTTESQRANPAFKRLAEFLEDEFWSIHPLGRNDSDPSQCI